MGVWAGPAFQPVDIAMPRTSQKFPKASGNVIRKLVHRNTAKARNQAARERLLGRTSGSNACQLARNTQCMAPRKAKVPMRPTFDKSLTIRSWEVALPQPIPRSGNFWKYPKASPMLQARSKPEPALYLFRRVALITSLTIGIEDAAIVITATIVVPAMAANFNARAADMVRVRKSTGKSSTARMNRPK